MAVAVQDVDASPWLWALYQLGPDALFHQRRVLGRVVASPLTAMNRNMMEFLIVTADLDVYEEDYSGASADVVAIRAAANRQEVPRGVPRAFAYRFRRDLTAAQYAAALRMAQARAAEQKMPRNQTETETQASNIAGEALQS